MENFNEIINGNQLTLVDFFATWCGPCKMMHPVLEQLKENFGDSIRILKIDVDKAQELAMNYRIQSVPTLMLFREGQHSCHPLRHRHSLEYNRAEDMHRDNLAA